MRRTAAFFLGAIACLLMCSCGAAQQDNAPEAVAKQTLHASITRNLTALYPLDYEYNLALLESDGSRASFVGITADYADKWKEEIEWNFSLLETFFSSESDEEGKILLHQSQQEWQAFCATTEELNTHLASRYEPTGGTKIAANQLKLFRDRAIELIMKCDQLGISASSPDDQS